MYNKGIRGGYHPVMNALTYSFMMMIQSYWYLFVLGMLVVVIVLTALLNYQRGHRRLHMQVRLIESTDQQIRQLPLEAHVAKLGDLAKFNAAFIPPFEQFNAEIPEFRESYERMVRSHIDELLHTLQDQKYPFVKSKLPEVHHILRQQRALADELLVKLQHYTEFERELTRAFEPIQKEVDRAIQRVSDKHEWYAPVEDALMEWVARFQEDAQVFRDYLRMGDFPEAKNLLASLTERQVFMVTWIDHNAPALEWIMSYVENRVNPVIERYESLVKEGYSFTNLPFLTYVKDFRFRIEEILATMRKGHGIDAHQDMQDLETNLKGFTKAFDDEIKARQTYEAKFTSITERALAIAAEFSNRWMREKATLNNVYTFTSEMDQTMQKFRDNVAQMNALRNEVDSAKYNNYPYTIQLERLLKLEETLLAVEGAQDQYRSTTLAMKDVMDQSHQLLIDSYDDLKRLEWRIRQPQFPPLLDFFDPYFIQANSYQNQLAKLLKTMPLDLVQTREVSSLLKTTLMELTKLAGMKLQELEQAEKMMLLANRFRASFGEVDRVCTRAEQFFDSCDFKSSIEIVTDVLNRNKLIASRF